jgi:hypothetical protein
MIEAEGDFEVKGESIEISVTFWTMLNIVL